MLLPSTDGKAVLLPPPVHVNLLGHGVEAHLVTSQGKAVVQVVQVLWRAAGGSAAAHATESLAQAQQTGESPCPAALPACRCPGAACLRTSPRRQRTTADAVRVRVRGGTCGNNSAAGPGCTGLRFKRNQAMRRNQAAVQSCGRPVALSCMRAITHLVVQSAAERPGGPLHVVHAGAQQSHGADERHDLGEAGQLQELSEEWVIKVRLATECLVRLEALPAVTRCTRTCRRDRWLAWQGRRRERWGPGTARGQLALRIAPEKAGPSASGALGDATACKRPGCLLHETCRRRLAAPCAANPPGNGPTHRHFGGGVGGNEWRAEPRWLASC